MPYRFPCLILVGMLSFTVRGAGLQNPSHGDEQFPAVMELSPASRLTIRVYDYAEMRPKELSRARGEASRVLAAAGINVRWEQCRTSDGDGSHDASCKQRAGSHVIQLRIHPREMSKKLTSRSIEFGYSIPLEHGFGVIAGVYLDRTRRAARSLGLDVHVMLGHTIAHEIGHLLLGTNSHAGKGVMRPTWSDRDVRLASTGILGFTETQASRMRDQVAQRIVSIHVREEGSHQD